MDTGQEINWQDESSALLLNPRMPENEASQLRRLAEIYAKPGHLWIASSGSSRRTNESLKLIALSKSAFLSSASAVNLHLKCSPRDVWVQVLPRFHVGGLAIEARAFLSGSQVISGLQSEKWNPEYFHKVIEQRKATITALVPTQVFDLIQGKIACPSSLRAVVVGGSLLPQPVYEKALELGWPLLPSYGLTECCSQVATANVSAWKSQDRQLQILSHIQVRLSEKGFLQIKSPALLTGFAQFKDGKENWSDPKVDGWYQTQDVCEIQEDILTVRGRQSDFIKIHGEGVSIQRLQETLEPLAQKILSLFWTELAVESVPDERSLNTICLVASHQVPEADLEKVISAFNDKVAPFEKIQRIKRVEKIPRTDLGKIAREKLKSLI